MAQKFDELLKEVINLELQSKTDLDRESIYIRVEIAKLKTMQLKCLDSWKEVEPGVWTGYDVVKLRRMIPKFFLDKLTDWTRSILNWGAFTPVNASIGGKWVVIPVIRIERWKMQEIFGASDNLYYDLTYLGDVAKDYDPQTINCDFIKTKANHGAPTSDGVALMKNPISDWLCYPKCFIPIDGVSLREVRQEVIGGAQ